MGIKTKVANKIKSLQVDMFAPELNQQKFDVLIQMAEGFYALAQKGYPGASKFLNTIFEAMGERFHTEYEYDDEGKLKLQGEFLKVLKEDKNFYKKKCLQFLKGATINLDLSSENETEATKAVVKEIEDITKTHVQELKETDKKASEDTFKQPKNKSEFKKQKTFELKSLKEANIDNARSRFDLVQNEFKKLIGDSTFMNGLDTNGIGFMAATATLISNVSDLDNINRAIKIAPAVLQATEPDESKSVSLDLSVSIAIKKEDKKTEKNKVLDYSEKLQTKIIRMIFKPIVKKFFAEFMADKKKKVNLSIKAIINHSPENEKLVLQKIGKEKSEDKVSRKSSSKLNVKIESTSYIQKLWNFLNPIKSDEPPPSESVFIETIAKATEELKNATFDLLSTTVDIINNDLSHKNFSKKTKDLIKEIEALQALKNEMEDKITGENAILDEKEKKLKTLEQKGVLNLSKKEKQGFNKLKKETLKSKTKIKYLKKQKESLFKKSLSTLKKLSGMPDLKDHPRLAALSNVADLSITRINLIHHLITAANAAYYAFAKNREPYKLIKNSLTQGKEDKKYDENLFKSFFIGKLKNIANIAINNVIEKMGTEISVVLSREHLKILETFEISLVTETRIPIIKINYENKKNVIEDLNKDLEEIDKENRNKTQARESLEKEINMLEQEITSMQASKEKLEKDKKQIILKDFENKILDIEAVTEPDIEQAIEANKSEIAEAKLLKQESIEANRKLQQNLEEVIKKENEQWGTYLKSYVVDSNNVKEIKQKMRENQQIIDEQTMVISQANINIQHLETQQQNILIQKNNLKQKKQKIEQLNNNEAIKNLSLSETTKSSLKEKENKIELVSSEINKKLNLLEQKKEKTKEILAEIGKDKQNLKQKTLQNALNKLSETDLSFFNNLYTNIEALKILKKENKNTQSAQLLEADINFKLKKIIQKISDKKIDTQSPELLEKYLALEKAISLYLKEHVSHDMKWPDLKELEKRLNDTIKERITVQEFIQSNEQLFNKIANNILEYIPKPATSKSDGVMLPTTDNNPQSILEAYTEAQNPIEAQKHTPTHLEKIQISKRKSDIEFLETVIDLLKKNEKMADLNKIVIFMGALNHLDKALQSGFFSFGITNYKIMIHNIKRKIFSEMQNDPELYKVYKALEKGQDDAFSQFIENHQERFKKIPIAQKSMKPTEQKTLLYQANSAQKRNKIPEPERKKTIRSKHTKNKPINLPGSGES